MESISLNTVNNVKGDEGIDMIALTALVSRTAGTRDPSTGHLRPFAPANRYELRKRQQLARKAVVNRLKDFSEEEEEEVEQNAEQMDEAAGQRLNLNGEAVDCNNNPEEVEGENQNSNAEIGQQPTRGEMFQSLANDGVAADDEPVVVIESAENGKDLVGEPEVTDDVTACSCCVVM